MSWVFFFFFGAKNKRKKKRPQEFQRREKINVWAAVLMGLNPLISGMFWRSKLDDLPSVFKI